MAPSKTTWRQLVQLLCLNYYYYSLFHELYLFCALGKCRVSTQNIEHLQSHSKEGNNDSCNLNVQLMKYYYRIQDSIETATQVLKYKMYLYYMYMDHNALYVIIS